MSFPTTQAHAGRWFGFPTACLLAVLLPSSGVHAQDGPGQHEPEEGPPPPIEGLAVRTGQARRPSTACSTTRPGTVRPS